MGTLLNKLGKERNTSGHLSDSQYTEWSNITEVRWAYYKYINLATCNKNPIIMNTGVFS